MSECFQPSLVMNTHLLDVTARRTIGKLDLELETALDDTDLSRADHEVTELSADVEATLLGDDEEVSAAERNRSARCSAMTLTLAKLTRCCRKRGVPWRRWRGTCGWRVPPWPEAVQFQRQSSVHR